MVNLPGSPGVGNRQGQHNAFLPPTPGLPLQGDLGRNIPCPEAYRRGQVAPDTRVFLLHGYFSTQF